MTKKKADEDRRDVDGYALHKMFVTTMYHCSGCGKTATIDVFSGICMECETCNEHATLSSALQLNVVFMQEEDSYDH